MAAIPAHSCFSDATRTNPIRVGLWSESVENLQIMQKSFAARGDMFKLTQSVMLQAFGGFGRDALRFFLTDIFLDKIGDADPHCIVPMVTCYTKWVRTEVTPANYPQLLVDLYNTCEVVALAKKNPCLPQCLQVCRRMLGSDDQTSNPDVYTVGTILDELRQTNTLIKVFSVVLHWYDTHNPHLLELFRVLREMDDNSLVSALMVLHDEILQDDCRRKKQTILLILTCIANNSQPHPLHVTEHVDIPQIFETVFPANLALPIRSLAETDD